MALKPEYKIVSGEKGNHRRAASGTGVGRMEARYDVSSGLKWRTANRGCYVRAPTPATRLKTSEDDSRKASPQESRCGPPEGKAQGKAWLTVICLGGRAFHRGY